MTLTTRARAVIASVAALAVLGPLGWFWHDSLIPDTYDMAAMGVADQGGGPPAEHRHTGGLSVAGLRGPSGEPDVRATLTARKDGGRYTLNGVTPGPEIRAELGQLIEVTLVNESVPDGVTLHWHGVDVPNGEDGVAGVTQDAVKPGQTHVYRFVAADSGTYWYHSHQASHEQVRGGLFGALVIASPAGDDPVVAVHTYEGRRTINGSPGLTPLPAGTGGPVRARVINTDAGPIRVWVSGGGFRVAAIDGRDVYQPDTVQGKAVLVTAGGRVDLEIPPTARIDVGGGAAIGAGEATAEPPDEIDFLTYGLSRPIGFDPERAGRHFDYRIGRRIGFLDGVPGMWWTVNGKLFPDVPMFMVNTGDVVRMTIRNDSGEVHPMHLHGHHAVVISRNGTAATGSPWWIDSLDVADGDAYEIAFVADNPGIWADHCHNLEHVPEGLVAHLAYAGVSTPYRVGGEAGNVPE
jgi:FtsP/CotA-like multicopper oxidase with cupredoxin domain